jgi:two-component system chemotaxis response regulator CheB
MTTRVLVVDDTSIFRHIVSEALSGIPEVEVVGTAANGRIALARVAALQPDLITLDIEMPEMNGLAVLDAMRASGQILKTSVIMLSSLTVTGGQMTIRALEAGAFDFITKPEGESPEKNLAHLRDHLRPMIQTLARQREIRSILHTKKPSPLLQRDPPAGAANTSARPRSKTGAPIVVIGVSTGGPTALAVLVPALPRNLGAPVFIVQHMPPLFTGALAQRLASLSAIPVKEAENGEVAHADCVYIAPGGKQMKLETGPLGQIVVCITDDPPENACKPSVDYLFRSVALNFPGRAIAAILTGMGNDGTAGMRMLKRGGSATIAQDEASCVVFGMPKEAILAGIVDTVVPLAKVAAVIVRAVGEVRP